MNEPIMNKVETRGRPRKPDHLKSQNCNFTVNHKVAKRLSRIKSAKSPFLSKILELMPEEWIKEYNANPKSWFPLFTRQA